MSWHINEHGLLIPEFNISVPKIPKILPGGHNLNQMLQTRAPRRRFLPFATQSYSNKANALGPVAYWRMSETSGTNADNYEGTAARDGTFQNTPTLNQTGIGDGLGAPLFTAANSEDVDIFSASFETAMGNMQQGTVAGWYKARVNGVWTDGVFRVFVTIRADGSNEIQMGLASGNTAVFWLHAAGGTTDQRNSANDNSGTDWFHMAMTWSVGDDEIKAYWNGVQEGATMTGVGTWAGAWDSNRVVICSRFSGGISPWDGYAAHVLAFDNALPGADITALATV